MTPVGATQVLSLAAPGAALLVLASRAARSRGRAAAFWALQAAGPALWLLAPRPAAFLAPAIGALALRPHPRPRGLDAARLCDAGLLWMAIGFVLVRLLLVPRAAVLPVRDDLAGGLAFVLALGTAALWSLVDDAGWRRSYGLLCAFAVAYGALSVGGNVPGLASGASFAILVLAGLEAREGRPRPSGALVLLLAGPGPLLFDLALDALAPRAAGAGHAAHLRLLLPVAAVVALAAAWRLHLNETAEAFARAEALVRAEEEQRASRLATLASMTASVIEELRAATADVVTRARAAAEAIGEKGGRVVAQSERACGIADEMASALSLVRAGARGPLDVGALLEQTVERAVDQGLGLAVSLTGLAGLPEILADEEALRTAFQHLLKNASQASPGGSLRVNAEVRGSGREVVLRFSDDGPGVPEELRARIFDPFVTTKRLGEGVGLGLTFVHFVARDLGGSIVLEPSEDGACFALHLPALAPGGERSGRSRGAVARRALLLLPLLRRAPGTLVSVNDLVRRVVEEREARLMQEGIRLRAWLAREVPAIPLDAPALKQALLGLLDNAALAIRGTRKEGVVEIFTALAGDEVVLRIADDRPRPDGTAGRLGLHVAREVVARHGGTISGLDRPQGGAEVEIRLPVAPAQGG